MHIVKVQQSQVTSCEKKQVLIYNEDRSINWQGDLPKDLQKRLGDRPKAYFEAVVDFKGILHINDEVKPQNW